MARHRHVLCCWLGSAGRGARRRGTRTRTARAGAEGTRRRWRPTRFRWRHKKAWLRTAAQLRSRTGKAAVAASATRRSGDRSHATYAMVRAGGSGWPDRPGEPAQAPGEAGPLRHEPSFRAPRHGGPASRAGELRKRLEDDRTRRPGRRRPSGRPGRPSRSSRSTGRPSRGRPGRSRPDVRGSRQGLPAGWTEGRITRRAPTATGSRARGSKRSDSRPGGSRRSCARQERLPPRGGRHRGDRVWATDAWSRQDNPDQPPWPDAPMPKLDAESR